MKKDFIPSQIYNVIESSETTLTSEQFFALTIPLFSQYTEEQALAVFGCFDGNRTGFICYPEFVKKITSNYQISAKKFAAMMAWAEREKQWGQLEDSFQQKMSKKEEEPAFPDPPRQRKQPKSSWGGGNNSEQEKVRRVYENFMAHPGLMEGHVPKSSLVLAWLQDEDMPLNMQDARRIVVALDPCDLEGDVASFEDFWNWWGIAYHGMSPELDAEKRGLGAMAPKPFDHHYEMPIRGGVPNWDSMAPPASARTFLNTMKINRRGVGAGYVPYHQRNQKQIPTYNYKQAAPVQKEAYQIGGRQQKSGSGHFMTSESFRPVGIGPTTGPVSFQSHRGGFRV